MARYPVTYNTANNVYHTTSVPINVNITGVEIRRTIPSGHELVANGGIEPGEPGYVDLYAQFGSVKVRPGAVTAAISITSTADEPNFILLHSSLSGSSFSQSVKTTSAGNIRCNAVVEAILTDEDS